MFTFFFTHWRVNLVRLDGILPLFVLLSGYTKANRSLTHIWTIFSILVRLVFVNKSLIATIDSVLTWCKLRNTDPREVEFALCYLIFVGAAWAATDCHAPRDCLSGLVSILNTVNRLLRTHCMICVIYFEFPRFLIASILPRILIVPHNFLIST